MRARCMCGGGLSRLDKKGDGDRSEEVERERKQMELYIQSKMFQKHLENWPDEEGDRWEGGWENQMVLRGKWRQQVKSFHAIGEGIPVPALAFL